MGESTEPFAGKWEMWQKSFSDGVEAPIAADDLYLRDEPQWSPDGKQLAYMRQNQSILKDQIVIWNSETREEREVTGWRGPILHVFDWSPDGRWLLASVENPETHRHEIWKIPASEHASAGHSSSETEQKIVAADEQSDLYQSRFSPDGRWIVFEAVCMSPQTDSSIFLVPSSGGEPLRVTNDKHWNDKPRWSPDGKAIYFISDRNGYYNLFRQDIDPSHGKPLGTAIQFTHFNDTSFMIDGAMADVGFSIAKDRLMLTMSRRSGSIWILDNIDR